VQAEHIPYFSYPQLPLHRAVSISLSHTAAMQLEGKITDITASDRIS
jgi:hypothetical protein